MSFEVFLNPKQPDLLKRTLFILKEKFSNTGKEKKIRVGLAGGSTPLELYAALAAALLREDKAFTDQLEWVLIDERQVPLTDSESNLGTLQKNLFEPAHIAPQNILAFDPALSGDEAVKKMEANLAERIHEEESFFDLLILGAGTDGHLASLFTAQDCENTALALQTVAKGYPTEKRWSLSFKLLRSAHNTLLLLKGEAKANMMEAIQKGELANSALARLMRVAPQIEFLESHE